jgi:hypothetical protein
MKNAKQTIGILIMLTIISSTVFYACKRIAEKENTSTPNSNMGTNMEATSQNGQDEVVLDNFSTLSANLLNEMGNLNKSNFCTLKTILQSTNSNENKIDAIAQREGLQGVHTAMLALNEYAEIHNPIALMQNVSNQTYYTNKLMPKVNFLEVVERPNIDCRAYKAQIDGCAFGFAACVTSSMISGPAMMVGIGLCGLTLMVCVDLADAANPACAIEAGRFPKIVREESVNLNDICNQ